MPCALAGVIAVLLAGSGLAQLNTGFLQGSARDASGVPIAAGAITITNSSGITWAIVTDNSGDFRAVLPYGRYVLRWPGGTAEFSVHAYETTVCRPAASAVCGPAMFRLGGRAYPSAHSLTGVLLRDSPVLVTAPLDFSGLHSNRLPVVSGRFFSWTATSFHFEGMNATDPYQPGRPVVVPDEQAVSEVAVRAAANESDTPPGAGVDAGIFLRESPGAWHGEFASDGTGSVFSADNLPAPGGRGTVMQTDRFNWYTRDHAAIGIPTTRRADLMVSLTGQWASQTIPRETPGNDLRSHLYFGNARGRVKTGAHSQFEALLSGSRLVRSDLGIPAGIEALAGHRLAALWFPFSGLAESDHLDFIQGGWTHQLHRTGVLQVRYSYSTAHLDTSPRDDGGPMVSRTELNGGTQSGLPPLWNLGIRTRNELELAAAPGEFRTGILRHLLAGAAGWERSQARNRFTAPGDMNLITANGSPAFVAELNTPLNSLARIDSYTISGSDEIAVASWLRVHAGAHFDASRGSLPPQSSPAGRFFPAQQLPALHTVISWNSISPRVSVSIAPLRANRILLRASFARMQLPLAGRYLDFANPNSLSGVLYRWRDAGGDPNARGPLIARFGGLYSGIDSALRRPYADQIIVGAEAALPWRINVRFEAYRRDDKDRIAAVNTGVPDAAYRPVTILDPGPDFIPGTFDDQRLTVYAQDPASFGQDRFLLTNPKGLRMLYEGVLAQAGVQKGATGVWASFLAGKSYGPTNPGNAPWENDPGVVGSLFQDPNTLVNAANRDYFDRAFVGKLQAHGTLPRLTGALVVGSAVTYLDGLVFGRQLLVTGLAPGPFLVNANVRGSPEGGQRAEYVFEWDLRVSRAFAIGREIVRLHADAFNLLNRGAKTVENPFSGPEFNLRPALAIQPPRMLRLGFEIAF